MYYTYIHMHIYYVWILLHEFSASIVNHLLLYYHSYLFVSAWTTKQLNSSKSSSYSWVMTLWMQPSHKNTHALLPSNKSLPIPALPDCQVSGAPPKLYPYTAHKQNPPLGNRSHYLLSWPHELNSESFICLSSTPQRKRERPLALC